MGHGFELRKKPKTEDVAKYNHSPYYIEDMVSCQKAFQEYLELVDGKKERDCSSPMR